jgi:tRNA pseudouridine38-40 synthase
MCDPSADLQGSADARPGPSAAAVAVAPPAEGRVRIRFVLAYDGGRYRGMAENQGVVTVAGSIREVIERAVGHAVDLSLSGRTDAGVHAWGQVVSFDAAADRADPERLAKAVNRRCAPGIVVREAAYASDDFDARFSARSRHYRYTVLNRSLPDPFLAATTWWVPEELDLDAMGLASEAVVGLHDYTTFCRRPTGQPGEPNMMRRVLHARWHDLGDGFLRFDIDAKAFCHQMVRSITGTLVDMGRGRRPAGEMAAILEARDRQAASSVAPAQGLCLWEVVY